MFIHFFYPVYHGLIRSDTQEQAHGRAYDVDIATYLLQPEHYKYAQVKGAFLYLKSKLLRLMGIYIFYFYLPVPTVLGMC